jgi:hypothetical protein
MARQRTGWSMKGSLARSSGMTASAVFCIDCVRVYTYPAPVPLTNRCYDCHLEHRQQQRDERRELYSTLRSMRREAWRSHSHPESSGYDERSLRSLFADHGITNNTDTDDVTSRPPPR